MYEGPIQDLIDALGQLPGIGPKSAQRIAFHLLDAPVEDVEHLASTLRSGRAGDHDTSGNARPRTR